MLLNRLQRYITCMFMSSIYIKIEEQCALQLSDWYFWISVCSIKSEPACFMLRIVENSIKIFCAAQCAGLHSGGVSSVNAVRP
jgi:hypothetical protein